MLTAARLLATTLLAAMALLAATATPAHASSSGSPCGPRDLSQPFKPWLDHAQYFLMPGGDLESTAGWTLSGGARLVEGNETFYAHSTADGHSLLIPQGGSARTSTICVDSDEPLMRFFVRNTGSVLSALAVEARVRTTVAGLTVTTALPLGIVPGTARTWQPSLPVLFELSANQLLGSSTVDFRFTPIGLGGKWQIDDVYVDPFKDRLPA
jgi:hypothetical protein